MISGVLYAFSIDLRITVDGQELINHSYNRGPLLLSSTYIVHNTFGCYYQLTLQILYQQYRMRMLICDPSTQNTALNSRG